MAPRFLSFLLCAVVVMVPVAAGTGSPTVPKAATEVAPSAQSGEAEELPPIREFDVATLSRLGREIYRHDQIAWHGTDAVFEKVGQAKMAEEKCCGWVVDTTGDEPLLRFVRKAGDGEEAAYDVRFPKEEKPTVTTPGNRELTERQKASRRALATATAGFVERQLPMCRCRSPFNFVALDDPTGSGFLVYLLRPKEANDAIPIGGHFRISVSADGKTVTQVDRLWKSCMTMNRNEGVPKDGKMVGVGMSHIVSDTPLETHVFLSLQEQLPFSVVTMDGRMWSVENGEIRRMNADN